MIIVVGAGVAGLTAVQRLASLGAQVTLVTAGRFGSDDIATGNTALAQGGIAAALGPGDDPVSHANDTVTAGAGLVVPEIAQLIASEGARLVEALLHAGFPADRNASGELAMGLEAAHSKPRIVHAGEDSTGSRLSAFLTSQVQQHIAATTVRLIDQAQLQQIHTGNQRVTGITVETPSGQRRLDAAAVILATGGFAGLFSNSSASAAITGEGILAAARAGAVLADMEFIQFHPTVVAGTGQLISEAVRGAGAVLRDNAGNRFMSSWHPDAELAPRDVVSRASAEVMARSGTAHVWLDATVIEHRHGAGTLTRRFPVLTQALAARGIDWTTQSVPVAPAAHYCMGGVATDSCGRTSLAGLYAAGEVASTGLHGANRLASNSLLEGFVVGARTATATQHDLPRNRWELDQGFNTLVASATELPMSCTAIGDGAQRADELQELIDSALGITRHRDDLVALLNRLASCHHPMTDLVRVIATAALARTESRGGHWRADYPHQDSTQAIRRAWRLVPTSQQPTTDASVPQPQETPIHADV